MRFIMPVILVILCLVTAVIYQQVWEMTKSLPAPILDVNEYWGPGEKSSYKENTELINNRLIYPDDDIENLKSLLNKTVVYHDPLEGVKFEYGFNTKTLSKIIDYWKNDYLPRWRKQELYLWKFPHFTTEIQGLRMHYLHTKVDRATTKKTIYPVILIHGWPGSVREFYDVIPKLALQDDKDYVFEVVVPSLPGYGWSEGASKQGLGTAEIAVILRNLMLRLGYKRFLVQGGDWGAVIGSNMATLFPENVIGYHSNLCVVRTLTSLLKTIMLDYIPSIAISEEHKEFYKPLGQKFRSLLRESGYYHIQATKPDTIGTALTGNPVGLAAYILEKFSTGTNPDYMYLEDGGLQKKYTLDALLDNVMIYYLTNSITTSQRLYYEQLSKREQDHKLDRVVTTVPYGCSRFQHDIMHMTDWQLKEKYVNMIHSTYHKNGGHFAALEHPDVLYKDFIEFVEKIRNLKTK